MQAKDLQLDYFLFYNIKPKPRVQYTPWLQGQFDEEPEDAQMTRLGYFACPVQKNKEDFYDPNAHFTVYLLAPQPGPPDPRKIRIVADNQLGTHKFDIDMNKERYLLVPAKKFERGLRLSAKLDHYKAYAIISDEKSLDQRVILKDQFGEVKTTLLKPIVFAVPVTKWHGGRIFDISNEKAHLLIYTIKTPSVDRAKTVADQFNCYGLHISDGARLAVPSLKTKARELPGK